MHLFKEYLLHHQLFHLSNWLLDFLHWNRFYNLQMSIEPTPCLHLIFQTKHDGRDYKIRLNFPDNYGLFIEIDGEPFSGPDRHIIRRLSTKSFADSLEIASSGSFHTQWRWYYKDKADVWIPYEGVCFHNAKSIQ